MSKFKAGDKVIRTRTGGRLQVGACYYISRVQACGFLLLGGVGGSFNPKGFALEQPRKTTTPHKHAALIHAWADGAVIECIVMRGTSTVWIRCDIPNWTGDVECYRIKPEKSAAELEKEAIIKEMEALKVRLSKLEV